MNFTFEKLVDKSNCGNMKGHMVSAMPERHGVMLSGAEIDYPSAPVIINALKSFSQRGIYGFTLADKPYFQAVQRWLKLARGLSVAKEEIIPTMGTIFSLGTALRAFTEAGDGVILHHPVYYRFDRMILRCGRRVVSNQMLEHNGSYKLDFADLEEKMSCPDNKMLVLCNPHNPTGKVFSENDLRQIAMLAEKYQVVVFSDEIFGEIAFDDHEVIPYNQVSPKTAILSTSLGKSFSLTGVNQANIIISDIKLRERFSAQRDVDHFGSIDPFFYTALLAGYSQEGYDWIQAMKVHTRANYQLMQDTFAEQMPALTLSPLEGTYVAWMDCRGLGMQGTELQAFMEQSAKLWADPGEEYGPGGEGFYRLNIATPRHQIELMLRNMEKAVSDQKKR